MLILLFASVAGATETTEPNTLDSYECDSSCMATSLSMNGDVVWYEEPIAVHPSEFDGVRQLARMVRRNGVLEIEQSPGCRQVVVEDLGSIRLVRTTNRLRPDGVCVEVASLFGRAVMVGEEGSQGRVSPVKQLASMATQAGLTLHTQTSLPWEVDFSGVTTLGEACQAMASQARLEGSSIRFGISYGSLVVYHFSPNRPVRSKEELRRADEKYRILAAAAKAAETAEADAAETRTE